MNGVKAPWIDQVGAIIALLVITVYAFTVMAPYFLPQGTNPDLIQLIDRNKGTVDTVTVAVVMFFFGASVGRSKDQESINVLAKSAQNAGIAAGASPEALVVPSGQSATATATDAGTVIERNDAPA